MTVSAGEVVYVLGKPPCSGSGLRWSGEEMNAALNDRVTAVLFDDEGKANIAEILSGLAETDFVWDGLRRILEDSDEIETWRVGEAIAEAYLTDHSSCSFPWPDAWDARKRGSSLPGADLVGFGIDNSGDCFAFGEVKTSSEHSYPPKTIYGRAGLKRQLENLRNDKSIRDDLVKYLGHRAVLAPWRARFKRAANRYLRNTSDVQLYGYLVRDVEPHSNDLRVLVSDLGISCPEGTRIKLFALYVPQGSLDNIGKAIISRRTGGQR